MTTDYTSLEPRGPVSSAYRFPEHPLERIFDYREQALAAVAEPWKGITADGAVTPDLFHLEETGVSTAGMSTATQDFLDGLSPGLRDDVVFDVDSDKWQQWSNRHPFVLRHGALLEALEDASRERALEVIRETLSPFGFRTARNIMRLNETLREITGLDDEFGEWLYWFTAFGQPSQDEPWGWQIDGHHLNVNCFVLGDQIVATPMFMGSEPCHAADGKYAGTRVFHEEEARGFALMQSLDRDRQTMAIIGEELPADVLTSAFRDNYELPYEGLPYTKMSSNQQRLLIEVIDAYTSKIRKEHAEIWMRDVRRHLGDTYFAWIGRTDQDSVFYYRIHSPVLLIEFDHVRGVALDLDEPYRDHIHTVVRTPNGNDYGKDLLRQHYERFSHENGRHVSRHERPPADTT